MKTSRFIKIAIIFLVQGFLFLVVSSSYSERKQVKFGQSGYYGMAEVLANVIARKAENIGVSVSRAKGAVDSIKSVVNNPEFWI